tara:strand:- start:1779 stop:1895 length:117 start_codon:yes stop_codon:yes gene_type:complete
MIIPIKMITKNLLIGLNKNLADEGSFSESERLKSSKTA